MRHLVLIQLASVVAIRVPTRIPTAVEFGTHATSPARAHLLQPRRENDDFYYLRNATNAATRQALAAEQAHATRCAEALRQRRDAVAAFVAACVATPIGVPAECAKRRAQCGATRREALGGGASLFDGYLATLARNIPYNAASFGSYGFFVGRGVSASAAGVLAGIATALATHPIDVVDARQQTARLTAGDPAPPGLLSRKTRLALLADPGCLVRGLAPRVASIAPSTWLFFRVFAPVRDAALSF